MSWKNANIDSMGENLGKQYTALFHEVAALHLYWKEFIELFGTNDKRIERLNKAAPSFFRMLQEQQFETNMSHLARLTDSPRSVGKSNLTVRSLPDLVSDSGLKDMLLTHVDEVKRTTGFCRDWRNRRFAHHDLLLATGHAHAKPLEAATKEKFAQALRAISDLLNVMERFIIRGFVILAQSPHTTAPQPYYSSWDLACRDANGCRRSLSREISRRRLTRQKQFSLTRAVGNCIPSAHT